MLRDDLRGGRSCRMDQVFKKMLLYAWILRDSKVVKKVCEGKGWSERVRLDAPPYLCI
jgi:hypothetical protein